MHEEINDHGREEMFVIQWEQGDEQHIVLFPTDFRDIGGTTNRDDAFVLWNRLLHLFTNRQNVFADRSTEFPVWAGTAPGSMFVETDDIAAVTACAGNFERLNPFGHGDGLLQAEC